MNDKTDVSTIVLDFNNMKSKLDEKEDIVQDDASLADLEFGTNTLSDQDSTSLQTLMPKRKIFLISYKTKYFDSKKDIFDNLPNTEMLEDITKLNKAITDHPDALFIMFFNDTPKAVNQISEQLKRKFPQASSIIIAKKLSAEKAKQHKESKYGADAYLNEPFVLEDLEEKLELLI